MNGAPQRSLDDVLTSNDRNLNHATKSNTEIYKGMTITSTGSTSSEEEWIHLSTIKRKQTTDKSVPSLHSEQYFAKSPAESVKKRNRTNAVQIPLSIGMPDTITMQLKQEAESYYYNCISQDIIKEESLNTYQGKKPIADKNGQLHDSSNGCVVISTLIANEHMVCKTALTNDQIESIIDGTAICWLPQVRHECGTDYQGHLEPWSVIHFFQNSEESRDFFQDCTTKAESVRGNILDDDKLYEFINLMKEDEKCAAILYFKHHEISILQNKDTDGSIFYKVIDSLPNGRVSATKTTCADSKSLFIALRYHAYRYLVQHDLTYIESTPWDENNQLLAETDPRIFECFVWRKSSNGPDSTPLPELVASMPPLLENVSSVEFNGKTFLKLTRNFQKYFCGTKKRLVNVLSKKKCENQFPGVKIHNATEQPNKGFVTVDFFGDDENTIREAADYLKELVDIAIADHEAIGHVSPPQPVETETIPSVVNRAEKTHIDDVPPHAAADANQCATWNDVNEDISRAIEAAASMEPTASDHHVVPSFSRAGTPKIDNLCCPSSSEKDDAISFDDEIMEQAIQSVDVNVSSVENMEVDLAMPDLGPPENDDTSASSTFQDSHVDDCAAIDGMGNEDIAKTAAFASSSQDTFPVNNEAPNSNRESLESSDTSLSHSSSEATYTKMFPLFYGDTDKLLIDDVLIENVYKKYPSVRIDRLTYSAGLDFRGDDDRNEEEMDEAIKYLSKEVQKRIDNWNADYVLKSGPMCLELDVKIDTKEAQRNRQRINFIECERTYTEHGVWLHNLADNHPLSTVLGSSTFTYILISQIKVGHNFQSIDSKKRYKELVKKAMDISPVVIFRLNVHRDDDLRQIKTEYIESDKHGLRCRDGIIYEGEHAHLFRTKISKRKGSRTSKKAKPTVPPAKRLRVPLATDHTSNDRLSETMRKKQRKHK